MVKKVLIVSVLFLFSCNQKTIEEELDEYCTCKKIQRETSKDFISCDSLMQVIIENHEYDPEAVPIIQRKLKECYGGE